MTVQIKGFVRKDGTVGIRNHVLVLPSVFCSNKVCEEVAASVDGAVTVEHAQGCGQIGADLEQTKRTFVGYALNPNVYAVVIIGLGCEDAAAQDIAADITAQSSKPIHIFTIQDIGGTYHSVNEGIKITKEFVTEAKQQPQENINFSELSIAFIPNLDEPDVNCSSAPIMKTLAEQMIEDQATIVFGDSQLLIPAYHALYSRCINTGVQEKLQTLYDSIKPVEGLADTSTQFFPSSSELKEVINYSERFTSQNGIVWMEGPHHNLEQITGLAASGVHLTIIGTGHGSMIGSPIMPVLKVASSNTLYESLGDDLDFNAGDVLKESAKIPKISKELYSTVVEIAKGCLTMSEEMGISDFGLQRIGPSI